MIRLDVWLKIARIFKTRSKAADALRAGHVKIGGESARPATHVKPGDRMTVTLPGLKRVIEVLAVTEKSVSKEMAKLLFREISREESVPPEFAAALRRARREAREAGREKFKSRPTKRDRRQWERMRDH